MTVSLRANAKINPTLRVLGRREDGFHELATTLVALDLADAVTVTARAGPGPVAVRVRGPFATNDVPADGSNLAARGADVARTLAGSDVGLDVDVVKNVPSRAGLGGGSADAAAAARAALAVIGTEGLAGVDARLAGALAELGSDCPFFDVARHTGAGCAVGRGEAVAPVQGPTGWWVALVTPDVDCPTPEVYGALGLAPGDANGADGRDERAAAEALFRLSAAEARARLVNDLEPAARRARPELDAWFDSAAAAGHAHVRLAGSGSTLFGLFDDEASARTAAAEIEAAASAAGLRARMSQVARAAGSALSAATANGVDA